MGFYLGAASLARLQGVHPRLVAIVQRAIVVTQQDFGVHDGLRTIERQRELVLRGASQTMRSMHLAQADGYGHAVDLVPYIDGQLRWEWPAIYPIAAAMQACAIELATPLRWGGVWDKVLNQLPRSAIGLAAEVRAYSPRHPGPDFLDGPHYEFAGV